LNAKIENGTFLISNNYGKIKSDRYDEKEQLCPLANFQLEIGFEI
jgi:hypothetical protein